LGFESSPRQRYTINEASDHAYNKEKNKQEENMTIAEMTQEDQASHEKAFRAGYRAGYNQGGSDYARFEFGGGSTTERVQRSDEDSAWQDFLTDL
jgi:flagellar biosynthesis/type III secretory pathway protein FliH